MGFKLVKTGNNYNRPRDTILHRQANAGLGSIPGGYRIKYPDAAARKWEMKEIVEAVRSEGYVLLWSSVLGDLIAFYGDEKDRRKIPPGFAPYSQAELEELFGEGKPQRPSATLRLIHEAKKRGGCVIPGGEDDGFAGRQAKW